jgi:uncharacterized protein
MDSKESVLHTQVVELVKREYDHPKIIGGFVGTTMAGLLSVGYIIEQLKMHQVAHVKSPHIPPVAVFVGSKLRHPFRIYSNDKGDLLAIISEVPVRDDGLYDISDAIIDWAKRIGATDLTILDGIPVNDIPPARKTYCIAEKDELAVCEKHGIPMAQSAIISGISGSLLSECLVKGFKGSSLVTPCSVDMPDPGSALSLVQSVSQKTSVGIDTKLLQESVQRLQTEIDAVMKQYNDLQNKKGGKSEEPMYR